jgi:Arc/MetJ-type ribon-helix-helix transcriptional regulator
VEDIRPEASRGTFDGRKKRKMRLVPLIIEDEGKIQAYVRDLAYKSASTNIKTALRSTTPKEGASTKLHEGLIPTRKEMNRILQVLCASL